VSPLAIIVTNGSRAHKGFRQNISAKSFMPLPLRGTQPPQFFGPWPQVGNKRY
jgi:hypothetical protein